MQRLCRGKKRNDQVCKNTAMKKRIYRPRTKQITRADYLVRACDYAHHSGRLSDDQVKEARLYHWTARQAGTALGVSASMVAQIRQGYKYGHVI